MTSLLDLQDAWQKDPRSKARALGGRYALDGFYYQFAVSLDRFFAAVLEGESRAAEIAFEGLSDLSESRDDFTYLIQVKTTLRLDSLRSAISETLAIDEFLERYFPIAQDRFRFKIITRRLRGSVPHEPATLTAVDLALDRVEAMRWEKLRERCLPVEVDSAPEVRLAVRLWSDVRRPVALINSCMGRLLSMLPSKAPPVDITNGLLALWDAERRDVKAPLHLLAAGDLTTRGPIGDQRRIVHGVRPSIADFADGCFMDRPSRLEAALAVIREHWASELKERRSRIPVFWISGPSGAGKSVLVLQVARELLDNGLMDAVNFIESYAHLLPRALDNAVGTSMPMIVAGDDLFSPDNRDPAIWREVGELSASHVFPSRFAILTCGPQEQLRAFKRECERHRVLEPVEIASEALQPEEQVAYHAWYQTRAGVDVPFSKEQIFVAAAWIYELYREEKLTPEAFASRFDNRLRDLGIANEGHAALALNVYGLKAPEALFAEHRDDLDQLVGERIWRLANPSTGTLSGRFFHPQISRVIYDSLVPREQLVPRAADIARGFDAMLVEGDPADAFLGWLGSDKIGKSRARGALMLNEPMRVEILKSLWSVFRRHGPVLEAVPRMLRWHQAILKAGIDVKAVGIKSRIRSWWEGADEDAQSWGLLFQMVWDAADDAERSTLISRGRDWLEAHANAGPWPWIFQRLLKFSSSNRQIRNLGLRWLQDNSNHDYWAMVWGGLFETREGDDEQGRAERESLLQLALKAIPIQPESEADLAIWERTSKLDPPIVEFLNAVFRKLAIVRSPYKIEKGIEFVLRFIASGELIEKLMPSLEDEMRGRAWPHLWMQLLVKRPSERALLPIGRDWLRGREDQPEWNYVWQKLIDQSFEHETLLPLGRDWLTRREDQPEWAFVWQKLIDQSFEHETLLPLGRDWLTGREDQPEWAFVWQKLIDRNFERETLLPLGRDWLTRREDQSEWSHIWEKLIDRNFEHETLLPLGRGWLTGREDRPEWNYVWRKLIDQNFEHKTLLALGRDWLTRREDQPEWSHVWRKLIDQSFEHETLLPLGRDWLTRREDQPEWAFVWQKLIDQSFERETLLPLGRDWLTGRENQPEWNYVWRKLIDQSFEHKTLLPVGRDWLTGREDEPEWNYVWQKLIDQSFEHKTLLPLGRDWLTGRENQPGWYAVARVIQAWQFSGRL